MFLILKYSDSKQRLVFYNLIEDVKTYYSKTPLLSYIIKKKELDHHFFKNLFFIELKKIFYSIDTYLIDKLIRESWSKGMLLGISCIDTIVLSFDYLIEYIKNSILQILKLNHEFSGTSIKINLPEFEFLLEGVITELDFDFYDTIKLKFEIKKIAYNVSYIKLCKKIVRNLKLNNNSIYHNFKKHPLLISVNLFNTEEESNVNLLTIQKKYHEKILKSTPEPEKYYGFFSEQDFEVIQDVIKNIPILLKDYISNFFNIFIELEKNNFDSSQFKLHYPDLNFVQSKRNKKVSEKDILIFCDYFIYLDQLFLFDKPKIVYKISINKFGSLIYDNNKNEIKINILKLKKTIKKVFPNFENYCIEKSSNNKFEIYLFINSETFLNNLLLYVNIKNNIDKNIKNFLDKILEKDGIIKN